MKNKAFNQTVAFTSESIEVHQKLMEEASQKHQDEDSIVSSVNQDPSAQDQVGSETANTFSPNTPSALNSQSIIKSTQPQKNNSKEEQSLSIPSQLNPTQIEQPSSMYSNQVEFQAASTQLGSDEHSETLGTEQENTTKSGSSEKKYDRFNRTVEMSSLELFEDPKSTGAAWMIRDKDDVIDHRDRLEIDNDEFYKDSTGEKVKNILPIIIVLLGVIFTAWLWLSQQTTAESQREEGKSSIEKTAKEGLDLPSPK